MATDQQEVPKAVEPPKAADKPAPMTEEWYLQELAALNERAEADGLKPLPLLARYLGRRGLAAIDRGFGFLLGENTAGEKKQ